MARAKYLHYKQNGLTMTIAPAIIVDCGIISPHVSITGYNQVFDDATCNGQSCIFASLQWRPLCTHDALYQAMTRVYASGFDINNNAIGQHDGNKITGVSLWGLDAPQYGQTQRAMLYWRGAWHEYYAGSAATMGTYGQVLYVM